MRIGYDSDLYLSCCESQLISDRDSTSTTRVLLMAHALRMAALEA